MTVAVLDSQHKTLTDKVASLTEELSPIRFGRENFNTGLNEITLMDQQLKADFGKSLSGMSKEILKTHVDMIDAGKL